MNNLFSSLDQKAKQDNIIGLQQQNFKEILQEMVNVDGWRILEDSELLALAAPSAINFVNFVWGRSTPQNIEKVRLFYGDAKFLWLTSEFENVNDLIQSEFVLEGEPFPEMLLEFAGYETPDSSDKVKVIRPQSESALKLWAETAIKTFGCSHDEFSEFFYPLVKFAHCVPLLVMYDNQPAGTAMVYCSKDTAGIYAMSTLEAFRRKGCAKAAVDTCISLAKKHGLDKAVLYASKIGEPLYQKLGFQKSVLLQEWQLKDQSC